MNSFKMADELLIISVTVVILSLLVAYLPKERSNRVFRLIKMLLSALPITRTVEAIQRVKADTKKDK